MRMRMFNLLFLTLAACSSFKTVKLDGAGTLNKGSGVPMILPKPEFVVKKVEGSDPEQYQVGVSYVPDPAQRYAVRLSSTPLAQIDLSLALNENGSLTSTSADVKDQIAPTALSLFKVAANAAVAFGSGGVFSLNDPQQPKDCFGLLDKPATAYRAICLIGLLQRSPHSRCAEVGDDIAGRMLPYVGEKNVDKDGPMGSLFARNDLEILCFAEASGEIGGLLASDPIIGQPEALADSFEARFNSASPTTDPLVRDAIIKTMKKAITEGDVAQVKRAYYLADDTSKGLAPKRFNAFLGEKVAATAADAAILTAVLTGLRLAPGTADISGLNHVQQIGDLLAEKKGFDAVPTLTPPAWKARYMASLQKRQMKLEQQALFNSMSSDPQQDRDVVANRKDMATLAGVRDEFERLRKFDAILDKMPAGPDGKHISPAIEYDTMSKEAAALETAINTAIAATLTGDTKPKSPSSLPLRTPWVSEQCVAQSVEERWRYTVGSESPEFVVVLRRADGTALEPVQEEIAKCGA